MKENLLSVHKLEVVYGRSVRAIQGVSFNVAEGTIVALVGLNGAGKTTAIRAITGFLPTENVRITDGEIHFEGRPVRGWQPFQASAAGIAVVPERNKVFEHLTVKENLELSLLTSRNHRIEGFRNCNDVFDQFPFLAEKRDEHALVLSGGQRQMLAIAACLLTGPRLLVVDEASLGLSPLMTKKIMQLLQDLNRRLGLTIVIVDQNVAEVLAIANYGYVLENGRIVFDDTAAALLGHGDVQEFYLGKKNGAESGYRTLKQYRRTRRWY
jgi:branched-chain amino acid transport system ATP-binding protein